MSQADKPEWVVLGQVQGVSGVSGLLKVYSYTEKMADIFQYRQWWLQHPQGQEWRPYALVMGRQQGKTLVAQLDGVSDREQAKSLTGALIAIPRAELPALPAGEYYWSDLVGLEVFNREGERLGQIEKILPTGANDVLVLRTEDGAERLIPYGHLVLQVDLQARRMDVDWQADY